MQEKSTTFPGYPPPTSSTTYTPNQFFDVVLPNSSRGVVRIVGYMLRRILGWSDAEGKPREPQLSFSYSELIERANVSRSMIREAIEEAIAKNFIRCIREPQPNLLGQRAVSGLYELCWANEETYIKEIENFRGFYSGNGNLTYIPNKFFDFTVREETLSVTKVVGAIIRNTIGFQTKYGMRRQQIEMSFTRLQQITGITSREVISEAIDEAIRKNHIIRVVEGEFRAGASSESTTSVYAIRWLDKVVSTDPNTKKSLPGDPTNFFASDETGRKSLSKTATGREADRDLRSISSSYGPRSGPRAIVSKESTPDGTVRNPDRGVRKGRLEIRTENGLISGPETVRKKDRERLEIRTGIEITEEITGNNNSKTVAVDWSESQERLIQVGFDEKAATELARKFPAEVVLRQIEDFPRRGAASNPLGLLRRAIEENWSSPAPLKPEEPRVQHPSRVPVRVSVSEPGDPGYAAFVGEEMERIAQERPELRTEFEDDDQKRQARLAQSNLITPEMLKRVMADFESERGKNERWKEFLLKKQVISSFPGWQKKAVNS